MREIHPHLLWIGNALDARDSRALFDAEIEAVVDVAFEEPPATLPRQLIYCRFPLNDGGGNRAAILLHAVQCTVDLLAAGTRTLVACSAGMSRSPTIAAFALSSHLDQPAEEVLLGIAQVGALEVKGPLWNDVAAVLPRVRAGR
ncbi:MAG: dual specificity protein phosphatase [Pirellulaceae bacterium]